MNEVVIVEGVRTATGVFGGSLSKIPAPVHGAECVKALWREQASSMKISMN